MADLTGSGAGFTPWSRLREESDADHAHFQLWLNLNPRVPPLDQALAIRHNWFERAAAFDSYQSVAGLSPRETAQNIFAMWSQAILNETRKWYGKSLRNRDEPVMQPHNISEFIDLVTDPTRSKAGAETHDVSKLSEEEQAQLLHLLGKAQVKS